VNPVVALRAERNKFMDDAPDPAGGKFRLKAREFERVNGPGPAPAGASEGPSEAPTQPEGALDVHEMLRTNTESEIAKGGYRVKPGDGTRLRRRVLTYCAALVAVDAPLSFVAWRSGHADPVPFVFSLAGMAYFTAQLTWEAWFLRTD
jgi:hypothetical protein